ncbi:MAG: sulfatase-like hydrolase/transferase [Pseudomonadota bacterium]
MSRSARIGAGLLLGLAAGYLLWPMPKSERWAIASDPALLAGKTAYLQQLADEHQQSSEGSPPPNVLLIVADDLARHDLSYQGGRLKTPNIDQLAAQSHTFTSAYANAAICAPSRAALLTGRVQNRFGFESQPMQRYVRNRGEFLGFRYLIDTDEMRPFLLDSYPSAEQMANQGLPASEITLAEVFKAQGYRTGIFGKWHLGYAADNGPAQFGFDTAYGFREAFTLFAPEDDPEIVAHHHDLFWEEHIWSMGRSGPSAIIRDGQPVDEKRYLTDAIAAETSAFIRDAANAGEPFFAYVPFSAPHTPFQARREDYEAITETRDHNERVYLAMIRRLDHAVGELVNTLQAENVLDNTLIIFTSDNGGAAYTEATDNGPLRGGKFTQFEGGLAVPLIVHEPGQTSQRQVAEPVWLTDLFATLLEASGAPLPDDRAYDSVSLTASPIPARPRFWRSDFNLAIRSGDWKLIVNRRENTVLLFNLAEDPAEARDLSAQEPEKVAELQQQLTTWETALAPAKWPRVMDYRFDDATGSYWFAI